MPESKRNFLKGKMNKDLDERLVPNGEYRDALNIEISTSEGSDKGVVQTSFGNKILTPEQNSDNRYSISSDATTVGTITDQKNGYIYDFIHNARTTTVESGVPSFTDGQGYFSDAIIEWKPRDKYTGQGDAFVEAKVVVSDIYQVWTKPAVFNTNIVTGVQASLRVNIRKGMRVQCLKSNGVDLWAGADIRVRNTPSVLSDTINITNVGFLQLQYGQTEREAEGALIVFTDDRVLNFAPSESTYDSITQASVKIPIGNIITGINLSNDYLMFTDGRNEPKKINILRAKRGSSGLDNHSKLYIEENGELKSVASDETGYLTVLEPLKEEHITVIRKNPNTAPKVSSSVNQTGNPLSVNIIGAQSVLSGPNAGSVIPQPAVAAYTTFRLAQPNGDIYEIGDVYYIQTLEETSYEIGNVLNIVGNISGSNAKLLINEVYSNNTYRVVIQQINPSYEGTIFETWGSTRLSSSTFYQETFIYFAYRYVYTDREKSCISPYSASTFLPGAYSYSPRDGFNLGAENIFDEVTVSNFIPHNIPKDVVAVEILFKTTDNENVFRTRTVKITDPAWEVEGDGNNKGKIVFESEITGTTLPLDQQLRPYDAVPRTAKAQEFSAGRLIYGNYVEDYNLIDDAGTPIVPKTFTGAESTNNTFELDITSSNNIDLFRIKGSSSNKQYWNQNFQQYKSFGINDVETPTNAPWVSISQYPIYCGYYSESDPGNNMNIPGNGSVATPYKYYYTAPITGSYTLDISVSGRLLETSASESAPGSLSTWGVGIFECDTNGVPLGLQSAPYTAVNPASFLAASGAAVLPGGPQMVVFNFPGYYTSQTILSHIQGVNFDVTLTLESGKHYAWYLLSKRNDNYGQTAGEGQNFLYNGISDQTTNTNTNVSIAPQMQIHKASVSIVESPSTTNTIATNQGVLSVKSDRDYSVGVLYRDSYGRESTVIVDEERNFNLNKAFADKRNFINTSIEHNAPNWAETYKLFIKETTSRYYNLVMDSAFSNNDGAYAWLVFNSSDRSKVQVGDVLKMKKKQGTNVAVTDEEAKWKIVDIQNEGSQTNEVGEQFEASVGGVTIPETVIASAAELIGKFFVKVSNDINFTTYVGDFTDLATLSNANGAVFETESKSILDLDLYYEVGDAYPIRLDEEHAETWIPVGSKISVYDFWSSTGAAAFFNEDGSSNPSSVASNTSGTVTSVNGAIAFSTELDIMSSIDDYCCLIQTTIQGNGPLVLEDGAIGAIGALYKVERPDGSYTTVLGVQDLLNGLVKVIPFTHPVAGGEWFKNKVQLPWSNCISFGNGVESDTIRDDFNQSSMWNYTANGKTSGFKASIQKDDYSERIEENQLIYSQIFNEDAGINRLNQFLAAENIVKKVNPENGSIQKLFSRDTNLVIFCESKVFRGPINKDIIFNADGNGQLVSSNKVIGTLSPYSSGDYGISTNPESFAADEFRIYFADKQRGAVLRLSSDGLTPIHEYGMEDWFNDNLSYATALVGSFDDKKEEYNLTVQQGNRNRPSDSYTLSFSELVNGWTSFKSFTPEQGLSINNQYFTFSNGKPYVHHNNSVNRNQYYGVDNNSTVTTLFNEAPSTVKSFKTLEYEGSQARVIARLENGQYYDEFAKDGWFVESIITDQQEGAVPTFVQKEGKWFNNIQGVEVRLSNNAKGIDTSNFSVQGVGQLSSDATIVTGSPAVQVYEFKIIPTFDSNYNGEWESDGLTESLSALVVGENNTFTLSSLGQVAIQASNFLVTASNSFYSAITFSDLGTPGTIANTVLATVTWTAQSLSAPQSISQEIRQASLATADGGNASNQVSAALYLDLYSRQEDANFFTVSFLPGTVLLPEFEQLFNNTPLRSASRYTLNGSVEAGDNITLANFEVAAIDGKVFNANAPLAQMLAPQQNSYAGSITLTEEITNEAGVVKARRYNYSGNLTEDIGISPVANRCIVDNGNLEAITATWSGIGSTVVANDALQFNQFVASNGDTPTFTISAGATWITSVGAASQAAIGGDVPGYQATINIEENTGAARAGFINVYSSFDTAQANPSQFSIAQNAADFVAIYQQNSDGTLLSESAFNTDRLAGYFSVFCLTNGEAPVVGDFSIAYDAGASGWITFDNAVISPFQAIELDSGQQVYQVTFQKLINDSVTANTATITYTHSDGSPSDTIEVTQFRNYNPAVDTVQFVDINGSAITTIAAPSYNPAAVTGYLLSSNASANPLASTEVPTIPGVFGNQNQVTINNIQAVTGEPYTHTYQLNFLANFNGIDLVMGASTFFVADSQPSSNLSSTADDTITITQSHYEVGTFLFFTNNPYGTSNDTVPSGNNPVLIPEYEFSSTALRWGGNYNTIGGILFDAPFFQATTGYALKYISYDDVPVSANYGDNFDWETESGGTVFNASSKPSWMSDVAITTTASPNGNYLDGVIGFKLSTNTGSYPRIAAIGLFANGNSSNIPDSELYIIQQN